MAIFENHVDLVMMDLPREKNNMCDRLNEIGLPEGILKLLLIDKEKNRAKAFMICRVAVLARRM